MKNSFLRSSAALKVTAVLALGSSGAMLILPGCSGGGGSNPLTGGTHETQRLNGSVDLGNNQSGALSVRVLSDNSASGTFTISNDAVFQARAAQAAASFAVGTYQISGTYDSSSGFIHLTGNIPSFGVFTITVTPPHGTTNGSFIAGFSDQQFTGVIPATTPTAVPTTGPTTGPTTVPTTTGTPGPTGTPHPTGTPGPTATPHPTTTPAPGGQVPIGHGPLTISLTSSNNALSGGALTNQIGATAVVDQIGGSNRINMATGSGTTFPIKLFNFLIAKTGTIKAGDTLTVPGDSGDYDVVTLTVTSTSGASSFRGQSGTLKITSVVGKKVSFTITNLKMVDENSASKTFNYNGSGSFTITS